MDLLQFKALMTAINKHNIQERIARVYDTMAGAQCAEKAIRDYVKALGKSVGIQTEEVFTEQDFLRDFGAGI